MSDIKELQEKILKFRDARNWAQYHNSKDLALCLSIEASELLELFLWKDSSQADPHKLRAELADVFYSVLLLAKENDIDLKQALIDKLAENEKKYPVETSWGSNKKYSDQ
jgi:NTP pyrophosphatase (non-canonical NTP hydrolase)